MSLMGIYILSAVVAITRFRDVTSNSAIFGVVGGVVAASAILLLWLLLIGVPYSLTVLRRRAADSALPHILVLSSLLQLLYEIDYVPRRSNPVWRRRWVHIIETAAGATEKYLPRVLNGEDARTDVWWQNKADGMAAALRDLKKLILAPRPDTWGFLVLHLRNQFACVATGDWDKVSWQDPQPIMARERRARLVNAGRILIIALGPALALWLVQLTPWALEGEVADRAIVIVLVWAAVSFLIRFDSQFHEKIETVQGVLSTPAVQRPKEEKRPQQTH
jgi:hypothetical protein